MNLKPLRLALAALAVAFPTFALAGPWSHTDGAGTTITLDTIPVRIIASQDAAAALIPLGIRPVGIYAFGAVSEAKTLEGLDLTGIEIIGESWGEVSIEKAAALQPDLIVDEFWPETKEWGGAGPELIGPNGQLAALAPVTGVTIARRMSSSSSVMRRLLWAWEHPETLVRPIRRASRPPVMPLLQLWRRNRS